ncbi:transporter substrate-binding domain-containing protein [uncultured Tateyamaria sp.]|uniref:substrate-binding periplasmic protein n=1 Tax=uncultured Tateyamaria sp. TaxID=455651 RepID=UPI0026097BEB|nr:transporter substrate-binding domain-containing protein [uncultured Tateyamaria sp.]
MIKYVFAAILAVTATFAAAQDRVLQVVADDWPPFSGPNLPDGGMSLDVIKAVLERAGYTVETRVVPWARIMDGARNGTVDIVGSLFADAELAKVLTYGDPFYATDIQLLQPVGAGHSYTSVEALRPYSIAVGDGFLYEETFDRADYLDKMVVTTTLQAVQMVAHGRADLTLDSVDVLRHVIEKDDPSLNDLVELVPGTMASQNLHMAVRTDLEGSAQIVADFNATLAEMRADGTLKALLQRHVSDQVNG